MTNSSPEFRAGLGTRSGAPATAEPSEAVPAAWNQPGTPAGTPPGAVRTGSAAGAALPAQFDVDLRRAPGRAAASATPAEAQAAAHATGYAAGWAEGRRAAKEAAKEARQLAETAEAEFSTARTVALERALRALAGSAIELEQRTVPAINDIEDMLVAAAFELAEAVLGRELRLAEDPGREAVSRALDLVPVGRPVTVRVSPDDFAALGSLSATEVAGRTVTLVQDPQLRVGDAIAESDATAVDARLGAALSRAAEALGLVVHPNAGGSALLGIGGIIDAGTAPGGGTVVLDPPHLPALHGERNSKHGVG